MSTSVMKVMQADGHWMVESEYDRAPYDSRQLAIAAAVHRAMEVGALLMIYEADGKLDAPVNFGK